MMSLKDYKKRLVRIWIVGVIGLIAIVGGVKWQGYRSGEAASQSISTDVLTTLLIAVLLPTLLVVRAYFRYKKWLHEQQDVEGPKS